MVLARVDINLLKRLIEYPMPNLVEIIEYMIHPIAILHKILSISFFSFSKSGHVLDDSWELLANGMC